MMYSSKLIQSGQNGDDAWTRYEMQPLGSLSLSPDQEPSEFVSLRVDSDNPVDFIPLVDDPVDGKRQRPWYRIRDPVCGASQHRGCGRRG